MKCLSLVVLLAVTAIKVSLGQERTFTITPNMDTVSDGIGNYQVTTLTKKQTHDHAATFGMFQSCQLMIDIAVGTVGGNTSHGALCRLHVGTSILPVFTCCDDMVGHAGTAYVRPHDATKANLIQFTMLRCFGG